jgi:hypothetical protein
VKQLRYEAVNGGIAAAALGLSGHGMVKAADVTIDAGACCRPVATRMQARCEGKIREICYDSLK